jgi:hypothetical protein
MENIKSFWRLNDVHYKKYILDNSNQNNADNEFRKLKNKFCIACTARSGSSFLTVALERYELDVREYFNTNGFLKEVHEKHGIITVNQFASYLVKNHSPNQFFGVKSPYAGLAVYSALGEFPVFVKDWKVVYLKRNNLLQQAISAYIASLTNQWTYVMKSQYEIKEEDYEFQKILNLIEAFARQNENWERFFSLLNVIPYRVTYEDLIKNSTLEIENIAHFIGIDISQYPESRSHEPWIKKQYTEINRIWEERFLEEIRLNHI